MTGWVYLKILVHIQKSMNVVHYILKLRMKDDGMISINAEKETD